MCTEIERAADKAFSLGERVAHCAPDKGVNELRMFAPLLTAATNFTF